MGGASDFSAYYRIKFQWIRMMKIMIMMMMVVIILILMMILLKIPSLNFSAHYQVFKPMNKQKKCNFGTSHIYSFMITVLHYSSGREHCYLILWQDFPNLVFTATTPQAVLICSQHFVRTMGQRSKQQCVRGQWKLYEYRQKYNIPFA